MLFKAVLDMSQDIPSMIYSKLCELTERDVVIYTIHETDVKNEYEVTYRIIGRIDKADAHIKTSRRTV